MMKLEIDKKSGPLKNYTEAAKSELVNYSKLQLYQPNPDKMLESKTVARKLMKKYAKSKDKLTRMLYEGEKSQNASQDILQLKLN